jgi:hypothetical protein
MSCVPLVLTSSCCFYKLQYREKNSHHQGTRNLSKATGLILVDRATLPLALVALGFPLACG